jgi:hypothetical protein
MFGLFKKRTAKSDEPPPPALGWNAIESAFCRVYPEQTPKAWAHGGVMSMHDLNHPPENPLDGVSMYDGGSFWHYVSFGMSDLYAKRSGEDWSGFGYELTFRLAKSENEQEPPLWPINILVSVARSAFMGSSFAPGHTVKMGPIDGNPETKITALLIAKDPAFEVQETPYGKLALLQLVGVEGEVRERALQTGVLEMIDQLQAIDENLVTTL